MALLTTLIFGIGPSVAKALLKSVLKDHPLIGDIAPDLLDMLCDKAKSERTQRDNNGRIATIGASVHTLRHTMATHHVARGTDLKTVQETLGHADLKTQYLRLTGQDCPTEGATGARVIVGAGRFWNRITNSVHQAGKAR